MANLPDYNTLFNVTFPNGQTAQAVRIHQGESPKRALGLLGFSINRPVIFISGGASKMSDRDIDLTQKIITEVAHFAEEHNILVIDGGTESGVMKMIGDTRDRLGYQFPLVGISPLGVVSFPNYPNPKSEAELEDNHTHFILVEGESWGDETVTIINAAYMISGENQYPAVGILVNGGKIAMQEMYLASTYPHVKKHMALVIIEGSGRAADEISTAYRTGVHEQQPVLKAIISGADIELVSTVEGPEMIRNRLNKRFNQQ
jgi:hypothetical protein